MDNFNLRKFLAESRQVQEKTSTPQYGSTGPSADDIFDPRAQAYEGAEEAMEEIVAEYVTEALQGQDIKEVAGIIEARCNRAAMEMKMETIAEVLAAYEGRLAEIKETAYFQEMVDETKLAAQEGMIKGLHEMAMAVKEEYKKTYMPEEVKEEEAVEEKKAPKKEKEDKEEKEEK